MCFRWWSTPRERTVDILMLADHFLHRFARKHGIKVTGMSDSSRSAIAAYRWPGNVRELQNTIERAVILSESARPITAASLGLPTDFSKNEAPPEGSGVDAPGVEEAVALDAVAAPEGGIVRLDEMEKQAIRAALRQTGGNRTQAATALGISIRTLRNKLQECRDAGVPADADLDTVDA